MAAEIQHPLTFKVQHLLLGPQSTKNPKALVFGTHLRVIDTKSWKSYCRNAYKDSTCCPVRAMLLDLDKSRAVSCHALCRVLCRLTSSLA